VDGVVTSYQLGGTASRTSASYEAGLTEIRDRLTGSRSFISIEGVGGVGKSSLAFQIARWASESRPTHRLLPHRMIPVLVDELDAGLKLDEIVIGKLRYVLDTPLSSAPLAEALIRERRVIAIVDGLSEMPVGSRTAIRPDRGAPDTRAMVVTSRTAVRLPEGVVVRPLSISLDHLDRLLDSLVSETVGAGRFGADDRESLRTGVKVLMNAIGRAGDLPAQVPILFVKLMIELADDLLRSGEDLNKLPGSAGELVDRVVADLLRAAPEPTKAVRSAQTAARVSLGPEFAPSWRTTFAFERGGVSTEILELLVSAGIFVKRTTS
jgi:hypothetical protein